MRLLFVNQYGPPDVSPTARLVGEVAEFLRQNGQEVKVICQEQDYHGRPARGPRRLWREWRALVAMAWAGLRVGKPAPEVVLAWSSPPGVLVVAALLAGWHRARLAHWAMDLYPELAIALGEVRAGSFVARLVGAAMRWAYRRAALVVALDEDMREHLQAFCRAPVRVLPPWPDPATERQADQTNVAGPLALPGPWVCLYSGNLGRAHEWRTLLEAQSLLEGRGLPITLTFQGDGAGRAGAQAYADQLGLRRCQWKDYAPKDQLLPTLLAAQVLVVTQRPETRGLLWPSKLALLERLPHPILFVGPTQGAIAKRLRARGNAGVFAPGEPEAVAQWVEDVFSGRSSGNMPSKHLAPSSAEQIALMQKWLLECAEDRSPGENSGH